MNEEYFQNRVSNSLHLEVSDAFNEPENQETQGFPAARYNLPQLYLSTVVFKYIFFK